MGIFGSLIKQQTLKTMAEVKTTPKNALIKVAKVEQTGDKDFGLEPKVLYYLLIINDKGTHRMNVGEKAYNVLKEMI